MITRLTLVSGNFYSSVGSKLVYFKVFTHFLLKIKALNGDKNNYWGKHISPLQEKWNWSILTFSSTRTISKACFYRYTQTTLHRNQSLHFMLSKKPTAHNQQKCYNHSIPFKLRNRRTLWCRHGYLVFHSQKSKPSCFVCFPLEIAFNST